MLLSDSPAQQLLVARQQACRVAAAVRAGGYVLAGAVQVEHLVDEGGADAEQFGHLADGAVASERGGENFLPQVERVSFHGAADYFNSLSALKCEPL